MADETVKETIILEDPPDRKGCLPKMGALTGVVLSVLFLLNLSFGIVEIPDNMPFVGNLDEVAATGLLLACLRYLGLDLLPFAQKLSPKKSK